MELKRVVVTGLGAITPLGNDVASYWNGLVNGVSGADLITKFDSEKFKTRFACEVKGFDALEFIDRRDARKMDLFSQYAVVSADEALQDAGLSGEEAPVNHDRVGVIWGSGIGGFQTFMNEAQNFHAGDGTPRFSPFFIPMMISDIAAAIAAEGGDDVNDGAAAEGGGCGHRVASIRVQVEFLHRIR